LVKPAVRCQPILLVLLGAALLLVGIAWLRSAEYDEQYTLFLTGRVARPVWSADVTTAGEIRRMQAPGAGLLTIAHDLRATDVDSVGIVGAFANEVPASSHILIVAPDASPQQIRAEVLRFSRVVLAMLAQDASSRATVPLMRAALADPCWRPVAEGFNVLAFDRLCVEQ
jgi:hypothetical protein